jgi:spore germination protein YaaH
MTTLAAARPWCRRAAPWALALVLALLLGAPALAGATSSAAPPADPEGGEAPQNPSPTPLQAFLLTSSPDSFTDLQAHVGAIGVVYPTYFECSPGGEAVGAADGAVDAYAAAHRLVEMPRFSCQNGQLVHRILTRPALRARVLARLVELASDPSYAGLNLDLENDGAGDRGALSAFAAALAASLHAEGRKLAVDVVGITREAVPRPATGFYDYRALSAVADMVFVMAWGAHWEGSGPGPIAPLSFVRGVARYVAALPHARRFVLGVPMYGLDWALSGEGGGSRGGRGGGAGGGGEGGRGGGGGAGGGAAPVRATALQYASALALAQSAGVAPVRDPASGELTFTYVRGGVSHRVWYMDASAILARVALARRYGLAAGVWRLGEEDQSLWSVY